MKFTKITRFFYGVSLFLAASTLERPCFGDELTFYAYPSPYRINWNSPSSLAWTTLAGQFARNDLYQRQHSIGHVNVEINCDANDGAPATHFLTGMTNSDNAEMNEALLSRGHGLGILLDTFKGRLESSEEIEKDLPGRYSEGTIAFLRYSISPKTCRRVVDYINEFYANGYDGFYGLPNRPRHREGSGCSAFGVSVLEIAGLMDPDFTSNWTRAIRIPRRFVGGPFTGKYITLFELLFGKHSSSWASEDDKGYSVFFWDPDRIYDWIQAKCASEATLAKSSHYKVEKRDRACGLYLDRSSAETPTEPFWL